MEVAVCVITYRRPEGLKRLLESLNALTFQGQAPDLRVVVVDNDENGLAQSVCHDVRSTLRWPLEYHVEPRRGIPFARNKAVAVAKHTADFIAFIDDDEVPEPNWLDELIRVQREHNADVVTGPVLPHFMEEPPEWVLKGKFFDLRRWETGEVLRVAFTGNILFRYDLFKTMERHFDERMALTGGSDSHFLRRVHLAGNKIVWADGAVAHEWVPSSRVGARWIWRRAYRIGAANAFIELDLHSSPRCAVGLLTTAYKRILTGLYLLPFSFGGRHKWVTAVRHIFFGVGVLAGLLGTRYQEYRRTHGG